MRLREIAEIISGEIKGDPEIEIKGVSGVTDAVAGEITFLSDRRYLKDCLSSKASAVIVREFIDDLKKPQIKVKNPYYAFAILLEHFHPREKEKEGISPDAHVSEGARIGRGVTIYPFVYVSEGAEIGDNSVVYPFVHIGRGSIVGSSCLIYPNVTIREGVKIGNRVIIHAGAVIGSDGFGYVFEQGRHHKIPQVGGVIIGDDVEIGANVTIDRATTGNTIIGNGTKIDNLVQIGHNVRVGENTIIVAQVGIGGSTTIGKYVMLGGQAGVSDHATIEDGTMVGAQSGVMGHLKQGIFSGTPVIPHREWLKASALFARLPEILKRIKEIEDKLERLRAMCDG
ncbi:MAG: UDP-3-O-(3-hydroxymyristoyl)glucosamine N-acyltransferase [Thermodesulfovibrionales bacterium]